MTRPAKCWPCFISILEPFRKGSMIRVIRHFRPQVVKQLRLEFEGCTESPWVVQKDDEGSIVRVSFQPRPSTCSLRTAVMKELCEWWRDTGVFESGIGPKWRGTVPDGWNMCIHSMLPANDHRQNSWRASTFSGWKSHYEHCVPFPPTPKTWQHVWNEDWSEAGILHCGSTKWVKEHQDKTHRNSNCIGGAGGRIAHSRASTAQRGIVIILYVPVLTPAVDVCISPETWNWC